MSIVNGCRNFRRPALSPPCQRKSTNVRFLLPARGCSLVVSKERRRAILARNPNPPELFADDETRWSMILPARSATGGSGRPAGGGTVPPQGSVLFFGFGFETASDHIDSDLPVVRCVSGIGRTLPSRHLLRLAPDACAGLTELRSALQIEVLIPRALLARRPRRHLLRWFGR